MRDIQLARGLSQNLESIGNTFIENFLDSYRGLEKTKDVISQNIETYDKAEILRDNILSFNDLYKKNFTTHQYEILEDIIIKKLLYLIKQEKLNIDRA